MTKEIATRHIVCYSGGHSSALVAIEVVRKYGPIQVDMPSYALGFKACQERTKTEPHLFAQQAKGAEKAPKRPVPLHAIRLYSDMQDRVGRYEPMLVASDATAYMDALESRNAELERHLNLILKTEEPTD